MIYRFQVFMASVRVDVETDYIQVARHSTFKFCRVPCYLYLILIPIYLVIHLILLTLMVRNAYCT